MIRRRSVLSGMAAGMAWAAEAAGLAAEAPGAATQPPGVFKMQPIGRVEKSAQTTILRIATEYVPGLLGLDGFSHVVVLYWFDRNDTPANRKILQVHPRGDKRNPLTGVFACRSPFRPNLIALSICRIVSIQDGAVKVDAIDAFDQTPILDLKPYIPALDSATEIKLPKWMGAKQR